jgi:hypothetical protein
LVGNIPGGGQPWSTLGGQANVNLRSGRLEFEIRGLVLAGGNSIGTPDAINQVKGTIVCGPGSATQFVADTPLVSLSAQGNAEFEGNVGPFPTVCAPTNLAFLVRIAAGRWIANGAVSHPPERPLIGLREEPRWPPPGSFLSQSRLGTAETACRFLPAMANARHPPNEGRISHAYSRNRIDRSRNADRKLGARGRPNLFDIAALVQCDLSRECEVLGQRHKASAE